VSTLMSRPSPGRPTCHPVSLRHSGPSALVPDRLRYETAQDRKGKAVAIRTLSKEECLSLLAQVPIGRVAVTIGALPAILTVNFRLLGESVIFCAGAGSALVRATDNKIVAFQADAFDIVRETGWAVMGVGPSTEVRNPEALLPAGSESFEPWTHGDMADHLMRVDLTGISGHMISGL
jgi:uncharacterized protein